MVDYTEPICQSIDSTLADTFTFDTSGIELYVTENNPKTLNSLIKKLKSYYKDNEKVGYNEYGYPTCPKDKYLDMKYVGRCHENWRSDCDK